MVKRVFDGLARLVTGFLIKIWLFKSDFRSKREPDEPNFECNQLFPGYVFHSAGYEWVTGRLRSNVTS
jgi:hypothetical protein